jgi:HD-like signal output (HDOD) protein/GGDEF domain-containing protein
MSPLSRRPNSLDDFASRARELYTLPAVAMEVLALADDSQADAARLKRTIERDPALVARLLRVVNSSLFGVSRQISDLGQAVALVGVKALKLLALGFSLPERMFANKSGDVLQHYWTRTLTRAVACREIAACAASRHAEDAFIAGLLGDLGVLVFIQEAGDRYLAMYRRARDGDPPLAVAERRYYGFNHVDLTARLLVDWKLPLVLCETVRQGLGIREVDPDERPKLTPTATILRLADQLSAIVVDERTDLWPQLLDEAGVFSTLHAEKLAEIAEKVQANVRDLAALLNVELIGEHSYRDVVFKAHDRMVNASEDVVDELLRKGRKTNDERAAAELEHELFDGLDDLRQDARRVTKGRPAKPSGRDPDAKSDEALVGEPAVAPGESSGPSSQTAKIRENMARRAASRKEAAEPTAGKSRNAGATVADPSADGLLGRLDEAITVCRQARTPLSLVLVELDRFREGLEKNGPLWGEYAMSLLEEALAAIEWPTRRLVRVADPRWGVVLPGVDRQRALRIVQDVILKYREICPMDEAGATTLSFGTATVNMPPRDFPAEELRTAADRCLYAAQAAAGDTSKSIEMC